MCRFLPESAVPDARPLVLSRSLRGLADGAVSVVLADYLTRLGFGSAQVGTLVFATLLGSALTTLATGLLRHRLPRRTLFGLAALPAYGPLLLVAFVGTRNPSAGNVSLLLPLEQAALAGTSSSRDRTMLLPLYNLAGACGRAAETLPEGRPPARGTLLARFLRRRLRASRTSRAASPRRSRRP